jgi:RNA methyltransferase, TrmH family
MITSTQNPKIQRIRDLLAHSRSRSEQKAFVIEGIRLVEEAVQSGVKPEIFYYSSQLNPRGMELIEKMRSAGIPNEEIDSSLMNRLSDTESSQGILAVIPESRAVLPDTLDFILILDSIKDPGNMGTILRTACAAGVNAVFLSPNCVDVYSPKVMRSAMGAHFKLPMIDSSWPLMKTEISSRIPVPAIFLADVRQGEPLWKCDLTFPIALIISSEATGASPEAIEIASHKIHIPMPGGFESLNASIAAAIILFEVVRQRTVQ